MRTWHVIVICLVVLGLFFCFIWPGGLLTGWCWDWNWFEKNKVPVVEPTQDPQMVALATQMAQIQEKLEATSPPDPVLASLAEEVAALKTSLEDLKQPSVLEKPAETPAPAEVVAPVQQEKTASGKWEIEYFAGATDEMKNWVFSNLDPMVWPEFPNVDNGQYLAAQGLEYGEDLTTFCQYQETCDFVVPARHYRDYTGDYKFEGVGECLGEGIKGCALAVFNVGEVTASFEDQWFDAGFTVWGRYWDGKYLPQAIWALLSHNSNNMLNMDSTLNPTVITNAGANCSVVDGCLSVEATFVVTSGNEILLIGRQTINK